MQTLSNKTALVTGAGSGIGKATALLLARAGANIAALSRTGEEVDAVAAEIESQGGKAISIVADISDDEDMAQALALVAERFGKLDIVVANAGINGVWAPIEEITPEEWDKTCLLYTSPSPRDS